MALLPMVIAFISVIFFAAIGLEALCVVVIIAEIGTLIFMVAKGKKETSQTLMTPEIPPAKTPVSNTTVDPTAHGSTVYKAKAEAGKNIKTATGPILPVWQQRPL